MKYEIRNKQIAIVVEQHGAELKSLVRNRDNTELLWQGDPAYWDGQSPVLFPTVGNCYEATIRHKGQTFPMPKHGLVRSMDFALERQTDDSLSLVVESNEQTLSHYPFPFQLTVNYQLQDNKLCISFHVTNTGKETMPFLLGAHPGFQLPNFEAQDKVHGYLGFDIKGKLTSLGLKPGGFVWRDGSFEVGLDDNDMLALTNTTFLCDTILDDLTRPRTCTLYNKGKEAIVTVRFDSPVLALWAPCGGCAPFVCIEPWWGLCDEYEYRGEYGERPFVNCVKGGETKTISYSIEVH